MSLTTNIIGVRAVVLGALIAGMVLLGGCGEDDRSERRTSGGASNWLPDNVEPLPGDETPAGTPTWFRRPADANDTAQPPAALGEASLVLSEELQPSETARDIQAGEATLMIPGGLLDEPTQLVVRKAAEPVAPPVEGVTPLATWEVDLAARRVFEKPIELRVPVDIAVVAPETTLPDPLAALYYSPESKAWVTTPVAYDAETKTATLRTRHLTLFTIVLRPLNNWFHYAVYTDHFSIFYSPIDLAYDTEVNNKRWIDHLEADLKKHGEPVGQARKIDDDEFEIHGQGTVPLYVLYLAKAFEDAWARYDHLGFPVPRHTRTDIYVGVNSPFTTSSHRGKLLGAITISPTSDWRPVTVRIATAHEFFHTVQAEYLGLAIMSMNYRTWWLEALAEYAPRTVWGETVYIRPLASDYFKQPLTTQDDKHEYATAHFISFLVNKKKIPFKTLVDGTLNVPAGILAMEEASAPDFAILKKLLGYDEPFDDYSAAVTYGMLDRVLRQAGTSIDECYGDYLAAVLFDANNTSLLADGWDLLRLASGDAPIAGLALTDEKVEQTLEAQPYGTACLWAVKVENPVADDPTAKRPPRRVKVSLAEPLAPRTRVNLYVLPENKRPAGGLEPAARLAGTTLETQLNVGPADVLYAAMVNTSHKPASAKITVESQMDFHVVPATVDAAERNQTLAFEAVLTGLPASMQPSTLKVRWTPVFGVREDQSVFARGAGAYSSYEYAWLHKGKYTLTAELMQDGKVIAANQAHVNIDAANEPSVTLEARQIIVAAGKEFSVTCTTDHVPPGITYKWNIAHKSLETDQPSVSHTIGQAGEYDLSVAVYTTDGQFLAKDEASITAEPGQDLVWVEDIDYRDGQKVVIRKYQVFRGTTTKHGLYLDWYTTEDEGQLETRKTFDHNVCIKSETFHKNGAPKAVEHFDKDGKYHGERTQHLEDGRRTLLANYAHGKKSGPYEKTVYGSSTFTRTSGRYADDLAEGTWSVHTGNWKTGKEYLKSTSEMSGGKRNGLHVTFMPDGRKSGEAHYRDDKLHGLKRSWYTWEVDDGIYYKMSELDYENGKAVRERKYNAAGDMLWEKEKN